MYKTSNDLRFRKNKAAMQKALMELALEQGLHAVNIKALTERAMVNRMTFYSHYDRIEDVICEYADDKAEQVLAELSDEEGFDIKTVIDKVQRIFEQDEEFIKMVYADARFGMCHQRFLDCFSGVLSCELAKVPSIDEHERTVVAGMLAHGIMQTLIDWTRGKFGNVALDEVTDPLEDFLERAIEAADKARA